MNFDLLSEYLLEDCGNLIMLVGPPGSGKSTLAQEIKQRYSNCQIVSPDEVRKEITGDANDQSRNKEVFVKVYSRIETLIKEGFNVIYDATNCRIQHRGKTLQAVKDYANNIICIVLPTSISECLKNNEKRYERTVPERVIESMYFTLRNHPPSSFEGYDVIIRA